MTERKINQEEFDSFIKAAYDVINAEQKVSWHYALMDLLREARGMDNFVGLFDEMLIRKLEIERRLKNGEEINLEEPFSD